MTRPSALPTTRTCCMCGAQMVEVRQSVAQPMRQDWQCPRCLHVEHVPVASARGPVCPSCGHRYNG